VYIFKLRRGSSTEWALKNPVLQAGEPAVEWDTNRFKIGDGSRSYLDLPYFVDETELESMINTSISNLEITSVPGPAGDSAYQTWLNAGNVGTEEDFLLSLVGPAGISIGSISDSHADIQVINTNLETVIASQLLPVDSISGDWYWLRVVGDLANNFGSAINMLWKVILGDTPAIVSNNLAIPTGVNRRQWQADIFALVATPQDVRLSVNFSGLTTNNPGWIIGSGTVVGVGSGSAAEDLTLGKYLQLSVILNTASPLVDCRVKTAVLLRAKREV